MTESAEKFEIARERSDPADGDAKNSHALRELYQYFAPTRAYILASGISQEELYADIDAAIAEVRAEKRAWRKRSIF